MRGKLALMGACFALVGCAAVPGVAPAPVAELPTYPEAPASAHPALWPAAHSPAAITDAATEAKITALVQRMTIEQKVGQLVQADISTITPADLAQYPLGSILAGGNSGPYNNERSSAADWHRLVSSFRTTSLQPGANGVAIPILFGVDAVHGHSNLPSATIFPHNVGLGAMHDPALIRRIGEATADEVSASGIEWTFAPTLAVPQDERWGRAYEGYSSDPRIVASYAGEMIRGLQGDLVSGRPIGNDRVAATAKHFLADGGTFGGKDQGDAKIDEATLIAVHSAGYPAAVDAGTLTVMISFSGWNGVKNHGNASLITGVLKDRMGFEGLTVGDWNGHGQVDGCTVTDCAQSVNAGLDMFMAPDSWKGLYASLLREARDGTIPATRLDDAVRRILRVKAKLGLLDGTRQDRLDPSAIGSPAHLALAREAVAKSLVLLKNEGSVLPIKPGAKVLITGPGADSMAMQAGGWTVSWQGSDVENKDFPNGQTIGQAIADAVRAAGGTAILDPKGQSAGKADVAIVVYGEPPYAEFLGDVPTLKYQPNGSTDLASLQRFRSAGIPTVSVFLSGRPMFTSAEINASDAFVAAWLPGTQGSGVADVLVADRGGHSRRDFTGNLSFAWPADARSPVAEPLFPLGYGLSYARPGHVGALSEDPKMDITAALNTDNFFAHGRAAAPWAMKVGDGGGERIVGAGAAASPTGAVSVTPVDLAAQEDARLLAWTGSGYVSIEGPTADLSRPLNNAFALRLDGRVDAVGTGPIKLGLGGVMLDTGPLLQTRPATIKIPLRCFADGGANLAALTNALRIESGPGTKYVLQSARVEAVGENLACPRVIK